MCMWREREGERERERRVEWIWEDLKYLMKQEEIQNRLHHHNRQTKGFQGEGEGEVKPQ